MGETLLNNYSDDSRIKEYLTKELAPRVFNDVPLNQLNVGQISLNNEYMSQAIEQMAFTSAFYFNESFITKAVLADSIYAEAAIFNIGYSFATPSCCNFLFELRIEDIKNNATYNPDNGLYEFILDKNTKFNLSNGSVYSLDYDILIQYKPVETKKTTSFGWNIQYYNKEESNILSVNNNTYVIYRVADPWLCLFVTASEYDRQSYVVVNNMTNGIPNQDTTITCLNHIAGFDIRYIDGSGNSQYLKRDHILPINANVKDTDPYVHYIMDNPQTIRFMWQLNGNKYFVPAVNSQYEIIVYTCHGEAANFTAYNNSENVQVITSSSKYSNNGNVTKCAFVISGSVGGTNIGTIETVRRETIEAYNTANVLSTDHDLNEWFKTFYFKNMLYPFFYKRRDDPWGRIWSGYIALKDDDDYIFRTNTLFGKISYDVLYSNNDNSVNSNEIIIPPGWIWLYNGENKHTVTPYTTGDNNIIEKANTNVDIDSKYVFANPFGIRIQKDPFAIGYFNPWINEYITTSHVLKLESNTTKDDNAEDISSIYHANAIATHIRRTYVDNFYRISTYITPTISEWMNTNDAYEPLVQYVQQNAVQPIFTTSMWIYFKEPLDPYSPDIPLLVLNNDNGRLPFDPEKTYFCTKSRARMSDGKWVISKNIWIDDQTDPNNNVNVSLPITIASTIESRYIGDDSIWSDDGLAEPIYVQGNTDILYYFQSDGDDPDYDDGVIFERMASQNYYQMRLKDTSSKGKIASITVSSAVITGLEKYGEDDLVMICGSTPDNNNNRYINVEFDDGVTGTFTIKNAQSIYIPWDSDEELPQPDEFGCYTFGYGNVGAGGVILYADMKANPQAGAVDYYRVKLSDIEKNQPMFHIENDILQLEKNNMRVVLHASMNGSEVGRIEMRPVVREKDGSILFETEMFPINQLVDVDGRIHIASTRDGGGGWISTNENGISISAENPELTISILIRSQNKERISEISPNDKTYIGYRLVDQYSLDNMSLVQEMKEMRSVVNFLDSSIPSESEMLLYNQMMNLNKEDSRSISDVMTYGNLYNVKDYTYKSSIKETPTIDFNTMQNLITYRVINDLNRMIFDYNNPDIVDPSAHVSTDDIETIVSMLNLLSTGSETTTVVSYDDENVVKGYYYNHNFYTDKSYTVKITPESNKFYIDITLNDSDESKWIAYKYKTTEGSYVQCDLICWTYADEVLSNYNDFVNKMFVKTNVNGGVEIQLIPFVEYRLMNSTRFENFVSSFTQVHKALEPVIMHRLDGNHYLDCKLIATYGLPHTYCADVDINKEGEEYFWPDLDIQIEFDVKLYNQSLSTNTLTELREIVKGYFNRLTKIHTPNEQLSMDNNIYVSHLIQQMEEHDNVAYMKFKGWYTNDNSNRMDANIQAIVQKWRRLDDFPKHWDSLEQREVSELEYFVPEMFVLEDKNIVLNIIQ